MEIIKWVLQLNCHIWIIGPFASHLNAICTWHLSICNIVKGQRDVILNTDACRHFTSHSFNL